MHFPAFLDTCVLYPIVLTDTLLRIAEQSVFRPHWSADVMTELERNLVKVPSVSKSLAESRVNAMNRAFPDAMVTGYEDLVSGMECDEKDRHVMAAAIASDCQIVVTYNLKDFPKPAMEKHQLEAVHPDAFLVDQLDLYPEEVVHALWRQSAESARPHLTPLRLIASLEKLQLSDFAAELRRRWPNLASGRW
ncbi:PIN domain-containing protein [Nocardioides luteus]|uniref:PIN domain-containing protein n=1 Tax=Nocardioides luteus TaxID=1844 RepID=UPI0018CA7B3D|nr:PIN domain-containing protein [Nocardioides luteus]MBG6094238.1 putative nucleic acid-binding protein [Nocardioides luteus]